VKARYLVVTDDITGGSGADLSVVHKALLVAYWSQSIVFYGGATYRQ
jgi:hypothetical protein